MMMAQAKSKIDNAAETAFDSVTRMELPQSVRDFAEKGVAQAKDAYAKFKVAADETSDMIEGAYTNASRGTSSLGLKALETARSNTNAFFDHAISMFGVKSVSDAIELNTSFARKQAETFAAQAREFGELVQKVGGEAVAPVKAQLDKAMKFPG
jgi:phasin